MLLDNPRESQIVRLWHHLLAERTRLTTAGGESIRVIYPGRAADGQGADFQDAVIATEQGLLKGDIEVHVRSSNWRTHQHHQNPQYNRVILHVVLIHDCPEPVLLQNGRSVPTLVIDKQLSEPDTLRLDSAYTKTALNMPCSVPRNSGMINQAAAFLNSHGESRFLARVTGFKEEITRYGPSQSLYRRIMEALGYAQNRHPFLELAHRLPIDLLESIARNVRPEAECLTYLQALLLGTAGLLPSQRQARHPESGDDRYRHTLERVWPSVQVGTAMPSAAWDMFRVRPANFPVRRLLTMSHLLLGYRQQGILAEMLDMVQRAEPGRGCHRLESRLMVTPDCRGQRHFEPGSGVRTNHLPLLGRGRAADIVVNVLLPFFFAWGELNSCPEIKLKSLDFYQSYPRLATNAIEKHMRKQLWLNAAVVNSAQRQQGLIHIYKTLCTEGKCSGCPLANT